MKNITLSIDEDILVKVRRYAAKHGTTVTDLIRTELERIVRQEDRVKHAMQEPREMSGLDAETGPVTWTRDEVHEH